MGKYFGTDGFRGEANVGLTVDHAFKVGRYLGAYFSKEHRAKIVIGKDTRRSSYMFEYALAAGITASGADAYLLHVISTPGVSYVTRTEDFDCGIMISASHNPFYDNGIKIVDGRGYKIEKRIEDEIEAYLDGEIPEAPLAKGERIGRTVDYVLGRNRYLGYLISLPTKSFKDVKVGLDCANGSAHQIAPAVFNALGAKTYVLGAEPDGTNINFQCGSTSVERLQVFVLEKGLDIGFAYDGDADRCIAVDDKGRIVDGDGILFVIGRYLKRRGGLKDDVLVTTVMSNLGLYLALEREGISYLKTDVGDKYVSEAIVKGDYSLGGEQSGHVIFSKYATTGDGVLTSLKMMEAMLDEKKRLSELCEELVLYPQLLKNLTVTDKNQAVENEEILALVEKEKEALGEEGRILLRKSGTENLVRIMVEAKKEEDCKKIAERITSAFKREGFLREGEGLN